MKNTGPTGKNVGNKDRGKRRTAALSFSQCMRCGLRFDGEQCPRCDKGMQPPASEPAPDPRAAQAWQDLKEQGLPVPLQPWTALDQYYAWVEQLNGSSVYDGWGTVEPADIARTRSKLPDEEA